MKTLKAIIEKGNDGLYSIYIPSIEGLFGAGETEKEAKEELMDAIDSAKEYAEDAGTWEGYEPLKNEFVIEYTYDLSGFFKTYSFFDVSSLASYIGLNPSLLRRYKSGLSKASDVQKQKIETAIHGIANQLSTAKF